MQTDVSRVCCGSSDDRWPHNCRRRGVRLDPRPSAKVVVRAKAPEADDKIVEWLRKGLGKAREQLAALAARPAEEFVTTTKNTWWTVLLTLRASRRLHRWFEA